MRAKKAKQNPFLLLIFFSETYWLLPSRPIPLLADCFTAIMSKLMMCLAVRQLIQLAAMSHLKMLISSAAHSLFMTDMSTAIDSVLAPPLPTHSAHK